MINENTGYAGVAARAPRVAWERRQPERHSPAQAATSGLWAPQCAKHAHVAANNRQTHHQSGQSGAQKTPPEEPGGQLPDKERKQQENDRYANRSV